MAKYSQTTSTFDWVVQSGSTYEETSLGLSLIGNGFGYVTGAFQNTAVFGAATLTATAPIEMFIARVHDLGVSGGAYERLSNPYKTVTSFGSTDEINIYPNPAKDKLNIDLSFSTDIKTSIVLCDLLGNTIKVIGEGVYNIKHIVTDIYNLPNGVYMIKVELPDKILIKKIPIIK